MKITLLLPPKELHPNGRWHYHARGKAARAYRAVACLRALVAMGGTAKAPRWAAATIQATFYVKTERRRDADNLLASLKAAFDGLADAGVVQNDAGFTHLPVRVEIDRKNPRVELEIKETT